MTHAVASMNTKNPFVARLLKGTTPMLALAAMLCAALPAAAQDDQKISEPGTLSKALRALGLESPPGVRGDKAYRKGDFEEAMRQYGQAADELDTAAPERRILDQNIGNTLYRQGRFEEAADYYERSLKRAGRDAGAAARAHYNRGNAFYRKAEAAFKADSSQLEPAIADLRDAVAHYKKSLRLDPKAPRTKQNLEKAGGLLKQLVARQERQRQQQGQPPKPPEPSARAKEALARALQLAQERRYADAAAVLDDIMRTDKTAAAFSAHRKRLDDVMKILRGERPDDPQPRDPRATPWKPGAPGRSLP